MVGDMDDDLADRGAGLRNVMEPQVENNYPLSKLATKLLTGFSDLSLVVPVENSDTVLNVDPHVSPRSLVPADMGSSFVRQTRTYHRNIRKIRTKFCCEGLINVGLISDTHPL